MAGVIYFNSRDELLRIDPEAIVYLEADGNYTKLRLANGFEGVVGISLAKMEKMLVASMGEAAKRYARIGKSHIVNMRQILKINPMRQELVLSDQRSFTYTLDISKDALRKLKDILMEKRQTAKKNNSL